MTNKEAESLSEMNQQPPSIPTTVPYTKPPSCGPVVGLSLSNEVSKPSPPPISPKPVTCRPEYPLPQPRPSEFSIQRFSSFEQPLLSIMQKQGTVTSSVRRSSSLDEKLHMTLYHPLLISAAAEESSYTNVRPITSVPSSPQSRSCMPLPVLSSSHTKLTGMVGKGASESGSVQRSAEEEKTLLLSSFLEKRKQDLPLRVKLTTGYQGVIEHHALSVGDVYDLYFLKQTKVIVAESDMSLRYYIPLNSAVQVSIPYQGSLNADGFTVLDLMSSSKPPLLMKALNSYQCSSPKHSVEEDEVLVVECTKTKKLSRHIKVFSITHQLAKKLKKNCTASFTTSATIFMSNVARNLSKSFPLKAILYFDQNACQSNAQSGNVLTLVKYESRSTVIASHLREDDTHSESIRMLEMPIDTDVSVSALCLDEHGRKSLCARTQNVLEHFDSSQIDVLSSNGETIRLIQKGHEMFGCALVVPPSLGLSDAAPQTDEDEEDNVYDDTALQKKVEEMKSVGGGGGGGDEGEIPVADISDLSMQLHVMRLMVETMQSETKAADTLGRSQVDTLRNEVLELKSSLVAVHNAMAGLTERLESAIAGMESAIAGMVQSQVSNSCREGGVRNVEIRQQDSAQDVAPLKILDNTQLLGVLKKMGLEQYQETFRSEMVTGEVLIHCDEDVLQHELGVSSKIHRIRLMKIIKESQLPISMLTL